MELHQPFDPAEIVRRIIAWYRRGGREFPWRESRDPYRIWLSEVMLQQTGVETVIPYYERFLERFPSLQALAAAEIDEVIELWAGLGYYSRARNLLLAAQKVVAEHGGIFPEELKEVMALPGVGRSTAGAILSIAFDRPAPILDGNVRRVLCRLIALQEDPRSAAAERILWARAEELTPAENPHDYAQAIMDLGATVCVPRNPHCPACPVEELCEGRRLGLEKEIPVRRKKMAVPVVTSVALLLYREGKVLVRKRPLEGMLGGLWEFPAVPVAGGKSPGEVAAALLNELGMEGDLEEAGRLRHVYSHFRLDLRLYRGTVCATLNIAEGAETRWLYPEQLSGFPLHGASKKALRFLDAEA